MIINTSKCKGHNFTHFGGYYFYRSKITLPCSVGVCCTTKWISQMYTHIPSLLSLPPTQPQLLLFSCSVMSNSLQPHGLQHARLPCPSQTPRACSNSCPSIQWCHPTISSSAIPFSSCLQSFPASESFPISPFFTSGDQNITASASVLPMNIRNWFPLGLTGWISLQSNGLSRVIQHHSSKALILWCSAFFIVQLSHPYMTTGKTIALTRWTFVEK